jgi:large subunit ribosomal protein L18
MKRRKTAYHARLRRHRRVRTKVHGTPARPRLAVYRSLSHIYAQVIDDEAGRTITAASDLEADLRKSNGRRKLETAKLVGELVARRSKEQGIKEVVFDRAGYRFHGRVKALADAAREAGLKF